MPSCLGNGSTANRQQRPHEPPCDRLDEAAYGGRIWPLYPKNGTLLGSKKGTLSEARQEKRKKIDFRTKIGNLKPGVSLINRRLRQILFLKCHVIPSNANQRAAVQDKNVRWRSVSGRTKRHFLGFGQLTVGWRTICCRNRLPFPLFRALPPRTQHGRFPTMTCCL